MEIIDKIVRFDLYCNTCKYKDVKDDEGFDPCNECLNNPSNQNSQKPVNYVKKEEDK